MRFINLFVGAMKLKGVFLDISKSFHKVQQKSLLHKLKEHDIWVNLLNDAAGFLYQWKHRVVLVGQYTSRAAIEVGVLQGCILGSLFFLIYINVLSDDLESDPKLFANNASLFCVGISPNQPKSQL